MRRLVFLAMAILFLIFCSSTVAEVKYFGEACLGEKNSLKILHLKGSPYEMGYQHGVLLKDLLKKSKKGLDKTFEEGSIGYSKTQMELAMKMLIPRLIKNTPPEYLEEIKGIAEGSGIDYEFLLFLNFYADMSFGGFCSGFVVRGNATKNNGIIHGRNLDYYNFMNVEDIVIFYQPNDGIPFVSISSPGIIGVLSGMNIEGMSLGWNLSTCKIKEQKLRGVPMALLMRKVIQYAKNINESIEILTKKHRNFGVNVIIADGKTKEGKVIELCTKKFAIREMTNDIVYSTNNYVDKNMIEEQTFNPFSERSNDCRYERYTQLLKENYGKIDVEKAIEILRDRYNCSSDIIDDYVGWKINVNCGNSPKDLATLQSVIFEPDKLNFWVAKGKIPAPDGMYIGFNFKEELNIEEKFGKIKNYPENIFINTNLYLSRQHYEKGKEYEKKKLYNEAIDEFKEAIKLDKKSFLPYFYLGDIYCNVKKDYDKAIETFKIGLKNVPKKRYNCDILSESQHSLGKAYLYKGDAENAAKELKKVLEECPRKYIKAHTHLHLGNAYDLLKKREKAIKAYKEVINLNIGKESVEKAKEYIEQPYR